MNKKSDKDKGAIIITIIALFFSMAFFIAAFTAARYYTDYKRLEYNYQQIENENQELKLQNSELTKAIEERF